MGCVASSIEKEERVQICKERKRLMKQLLVFRGEFADGLFAYLRALKNSGVTLRQFTESESLELENHTYSLALPPPPPPPLPPSPPPPPFSPDLRKFDDEDDDGKEGVEREESIEIDEVHSSTLPPPIASSSWDLWYPFGAFSPDGEQNESVEQVEEENWAETNTEFEEENQEERQEEGIADDESNTHGEKLQAVEMVDDDVSMMSWFTNGTADMTMVEWRSKKTLESIVKELDDYFLKASAGAKEIAVLMDIDRGDTSLPKNFKRKRSNSAKVFSALSWSWSSRSLQYSRDTVKYGNPNEPCKPGAHCITLEKLYSEEQKLYKEVKDEEITKLEHERKLMLLQKQEDEGHEWAKTDKTRLIVESLQSDLIYLQESITQTCSSILKIIDEELHPQLVMLTSGLMHMWRTMYECHQVQHHISQHMNNIIDNQSADPTTDYHRQAIAQLETEVNCWYNSFCKLVKSQKDYVRTLNGWIQLTKCLVDDGQQSACLSAVRTLCAEWLLNLDKISEKVASDAIKSFLSAIHSILLQLSEEHNLQKKTDKLEKRMQKELQSLAEMENKLDGSVVATGEAPSVLSPKHPLSIKRDKIETLKKRVDCEKAKYQNSVQVSRAMILNNLKMSLPNVFQALMVFSSACARALESLHNKAKPAACDDEGSQNLRN